MTDEISQTSEKTQSSLREDILSYNITEDQEYFPLLDETDQITAGYAWRSIQNLILTEQLSPKTMLEVKKIADFGAGSGGSTVADLILARAIGRYTGATPTVDVFEKYKPHRKEMVERGIVKGNIHGEDATKILRQERFRRQYDLLTAFLFADRDYEDTEIFSRMILRAAAECLSPNGNLIINSDEERMRLLKRVCNNLNIKYNEAKGVYEPKEELFPTTFVIPQRETAKALTTNY